MSKEHPQVTKWISFFKKRNSSSQVTFFCNIQSNHMTKAWQDGNCYMEKTLSQKWYLGDGKSFPIDVLRSCPAVVFESRWPSIVTGTILSSTVAYIFEMGDDTKFTSIPVGAVGGGQVWSLLCFEAMLRMNVRKSLVSPNITFWNG